MSPFLNPMFYFSFLYFFLSLYISYNLTVTMNDNAHTTGWTDGSKGTPDGIMKIVNEIKKVSSNEGLV